MDTLNNSVIRDIGEKYVKAGILTLESITLQNGGADCIIQYAINGTETDIRKDDPVKRRLYQLFFSKHIIYVASMI